MDQIITVTIFAIAIFAISLGASRIPFVIRKDFKQLHTLIAFSAGVMLGVLFILLMPEAIEETLEAEYESSMVTYLVLAGFLVVFIINFLVKKHLTVTCACRSCADEHTHDFTSLSAFAGLSIHAFFDGLALAAAFIAGEDVGILVLVAICLHKSVEVFALSSTMLMSKNKRCTGKFLIAFCAITPVAALLSYLLMNGESLDITGPALCFSVGVFLYVVMCDMLPESFHNREKDTNQMLAVLLGIVLVAIVAVISHTLMGGIEL